MHGKEDGPEFNAILGIAFLTAINVASIPGLLELFFGIQIIQTPEAIPTWSIVTFMIAITTVNYFMFVHNREYKKIEGKFNRYNKEWQLKATILVWLYIVISLIALFVPWIILAERNSH